MLGVKTIARANGEQSDQQAAAAEYSKHHKEAKKSRGKIYLEYTQGLYTQWRLESVCG